MKKCISISTTVMFFLMFGPAVALAGDNIVIFFKDGKQQTVDTETVEKIEFQGKTASSGSYGNMPAPVSGRTVHIVSKNSGKCLDVAGAGTHDGANVQQYDCHSGANQLWTLTDKGNGYYLITAKNSGKCLDVAGVATHNGANVQQYDCHSGPNQLWTLTDKGNGYYLITAKNSGKCLDVAGVATHNGANVQQYDCHSGPNQLWTLTDKGNGYYLITAKNSGKCLDVAGVATHSGANVQQYDCHSGANQLWKLDGATARGNIVNLALNKPARQSSVYGGTGVDQGPHFGVDGIRESVPRDPYLLVHTNADNPPWWQVDLQNVYALTELRLYNRIFCCGEKNRTIQVYLSSNGSNWEKAYQHDGSNFKVLTVNLQGRNAKFVRLQLAESTFLHFQECEVYGNLTSTR
jgi:hypothetical protein